MTPDDLESNMARAAELQGESNRSGFAFLSTDLETSLTFAKIALDSGDDAEKRQRNRAHARRGYDVIIHFIQKFDPSAADATQLADIQEKLRTLKSALLDLGEELT